ncbi:MAG: helix-turn-helix domain-containing protein, partial [Collinsella sp.]
VSRQAVSKWERSESSPDTDNLIALAALYGVSLDELLYGEAASDADSSEDGSTETVDEAKEAEDSAEHADCGDKPLVDISLARGIHVIDPNKGEEVHVGWNGIHVTNERKGEEVHVGPDGVHVNTLEDDGHSVHTNDDRHRHHRRRDVLSWKEAHDKLDHHGKHFHIKVGRTWNKFPFRACRPRLSGARHCLRHMGHGALARLFGSAYYAIGDFIDRRHLSKLIECIYPSAAIAWFLYMWLCLGQPHPAWAILITIPVIKALMRWCRKQWKHRKRA